MNNKFLSIFLMAAFSFGQCVDAKSNDSTIVNSFIKSQAKKNGGVGSLKQILTGDINQNGVPETIALYTIEGQGGGNYGVQYLVVFERSNDTLKPIAPLELGNTVGEGRIVESLALGANYIEAKTIAYSPDDARCCPSIAGKTFFVLDNSKLNEQISTPVVVSKATENAVPVYEISTLFKGNENSCEPDEKLMSFFDGLSKKTFNVDNSIQKAFLSMNSKVEGNGNGGSYILYSIETVAKYYGLPVSKITHYAGVDSGMYGWSLTIDLPLKEVEKKLKQSNVVFKKTKSEADDVVLGIEFKAVEKNKTKAICDISN